MATRKTLGQARQMQHQLSSSRLVSTYSFSMIDVRTWRISVRKQGLITFFQRRPRTSQVMEKQRHQTNKEAILYMIQINQYGVFVQINRFERNDPICLFNLITMSNRSQEDKFKNITLTFTPNSQMHTSSIVKSSNIEARQFHRPSTPINASKYITQPTRNINIQIKTSQILSNDKLSHHSSSPLQQSHRNHRIILDYQLSDDLSDDREPRDSESIKQLKQELTQKQEIISELKNIIKLSNDNNSRIRPKSMYMTDKSPELDKQATQDERQIKELKHNVKVLTIQNNALSGYIDKLKNELGEKNKQLESNRSELAANRNGESFEREEQELRRIAFLQSENERLKELVQVQQSSYDRKIDEFIISHKSLASECKKIQQQKQAIEQENQRLTFLLREMEDTKRKANSRDEDIFGKTINHRLSISKIKSQYQESIKQIEQNIRVQFESAFEEINTVLKGLRQQLQHLQRRLSRIQSRLQSKKPDISRTQKRQKQDIYIEQGTDSVTSQRAIIKSNHKQVTASRLYESPQTTTQDRQRQRQSIKCLQNEVLKLKEIISSLQSRSGQRSDYYTFRERSDIFSAQMISYRATSRQRQEQIAHLRQQKHQRESDLFDEINRLKEEIQKLDIQYKEQRQSNQQRLQDQIQSREMKISQLTNEIDSLRQKYNQCLQQMKQLISIKRNQQDIYEQNEYLKMEREINQKKLEKYKKLCQLMQSESQENEVNTELFEEMKKQLNQLKEKFKHEIIKFNSVEKQNKEVLAANKELKCKLELSLGNNKKIIIELQQIAQKLKESQRLKQELSHKLNYNQNIVVILQQQLKSKKQTQLTLIQQKNILEKQLISYLSIFNKIDFEGDRSSIRNSSPSQKLGIQQILHKLSHLQASFNGFNTSSREKRQLISKMITGQIQQIDLSSIKRTK